MAATPKFGDITTAPCSWCGREITKVWRKYDFCADGFWSDEACVCGELTSIGGWANGMRLMGRTKGPNHAKWKAIKKEGGLGKALDLDFSRRASK